MDDYFARGNVFVLVGGGVYVIKLLVRSLFLSNIFRSKRLIIRL